MKEKYFFIMEKNDFEKKNRRPKNIFSIKKKFVIHHHHPTPLHIQEDPNPVLCHPIFTGQVRKHPLPSGELVMGSLAAPMFVWVVYQAPFTPRCLELRCRTAWRCADFPEEISRDPGQITPLPGLLKTTFRRPHPSYVRTQIPIIFHAIPWGVAMAMTSPCSKTKIRQAIEYLIGPVRSDLRGNGSHIRNTVSLATSMYGHLR